MRFIKQKEVVARGCHYCTHRMVGDAGKVYACDKYECPYGELDGYDNFKDYLNDNGIGIDENLLK